MERRGDENITVVVRPSGDRIVTVVDDNGYLVRRSRILPDGREITIIDNRPRALGYGPRYQSGQGFGAFFVDLPPPVIRIPRDRYVVEAARANRRFSTTRCWRRPSTSSSAPIRSMKSAIAPRCGIACRESTSTPSPSNWAHGSWALIRSNASLSSLKASTASCSKTHARSS